MGEFAVGGIAMLVKWFPAIEAASKSPLGTICLAMIIADIAFGTLIPKLEGSSDRLTAWVIFVALIGLTLAAFVAVVYLNSRPPSRTDVLEAREIPTRAEYYRELAHLIRQSKTILDTTWG